MGNAVYQKSWILIVAVSCLVSTHSAEAQSISTDSTTTTSRPSLDTSSKLSAYWLRTAITVTMSYNISDPTLLNTIEDRLLTAYLTAKQKSSVGSRKRRAALSGTTSVQLVQATRTDASGSVDLNYYFNVGGVNVPAATAVAVMKLLSIADLSSILGYPVKTVADAYTGSPLNSATNLWIIAAVLGPLAAIVIITWLVLFIYITCLRPFTASEVLASMSDSKSTRIEQQVQHIQMKHANPPTDSTVNLKDAMQVEYLQQSEKLGPVDVMVYPVVATQYSKTLEILHQQKAISQVTQKLSSSPQVNESYEESESEEEVNDEIFFENEVTKEKENKVDAAAVVEKKLETEKAKEESENESEVSVKKEKEKKDKKKKKKSKDKEKKKKDKDKHKDDESPKSKKKSKKAKKPSESASDISLHESQTHNVLKAGKKNESDSEEELHGVPVKAARETHVPIRVMTSIRPEAFEAAKISSHSWYAAGDEMHRLRPALEKDLQANIQVIDVRTVDPIHKRPLSPPKDSEIIVVTPTSKPNPHPSIIQVKPRTKSPNDVSFSLTSAPSQGSEVRVIPTIDTLDEILASELSHNQQVPRRPRHKTSIEEPYQSDPVGTNWFNKDELDVVTEVMQPGASARPLVESIRNELNRLAESNYHG